MMKALRASRISEVEWNARRQKLEGLYLDDNLSRQEVVEKMAEEDNFFATEKQLKYRFNKWGLKKYIRDQDLTAILSLKRKRQELGKDTGFVYRGHLFEQDRLERASNRRKGPLMSSPDLPPYIRALVSPRQSPQMTCLLSSHRQTSAVPNGFEQATHDRGRPGSLDLLSNHQSRDSGSNDAFDNLDVFADPTFFNDGEQNQANGGLWETLLHNSIMSSSPGYRSFMPSPSGRDIQATRTENPSPLPAQITSIPPYEQSAHDNGFPSSDSNLDLDFSMFLNSPRTLSTPPSSSLTASHPRRSVERSISPLQLTDHHDPHGESRGFNLISETNPAAARSFDPVTVDDVTAESTASLLLLLKSFVFPRFVGLQSLRKLTPSTLFQMILRSSSASARTILGVYKHYLTMEQHPLATLTLVAYHSLLYYAVFRGNFDVFRLLLQGGASTKACKDNGELQDIITVIWSIYTDTHTVFHGTTLPLENLKNFEQCVAMTQLAIDNDRTIDSAKPLASAASPLFWLIGTKSDPHAPALAGTSRRRIATGKHPFFTQQLGVIRNPSHVLKDRVKIKLKILLEAGCDPNDLDNNGLSTNDYASRGLWSQWLWALGMKGYVFDEEQNRWIKQIDTA